MAKISNISAAVKAAIKKRSAFVLPNNPTAAGWSAEDIRKVLYKPIIDATWSMIAELDRLINDINEMGAFDDLDTIITDDSDLLVGSEGLLYEMNGTELCVRGYRSVSEFLKIPGRVKYDGKFYHVGSIGERAFIANTDIVELDVPSSITYIGSQAFYGCSMLKKVTFHGNNLFGTNVFSRKVDFFVPEEHFERYANDLSYVGGNIYSFPTIANNAANIKGLRSSVAFSINLKVEANTAYIVLLNKSGEEISRAEIDLTVTEARLSTELRGRIENIEGTAYTDVIYNKTTGELTFITPSGIEESIFLPLPDGSRGDPGKSAYEIAVENGFSGTEAQWLDSLRGGPGSPGPKGEDGAPFMVSKVYSSVAAMNAGYKTDGLPVGAFAVIDTGNVEDEENARLYIKGEKVYEFITDLSGAEGIQGPPGSSITVASVQESNVDGGSNIVTFSDGNKLTVRNGNKGSSVGIASVTVSTSAGGTNVVEFTDGNTLEVKNGANGTSVTVKKVTESSEDGGSNIVEFSGGTTLTVKNGSKGEKYVLTDTDKAEIVGMVIASLPIAEGGSF